MSTDSQSLSIDVGLFILECPAHRGNADLCMTIDDRQLPLTKSERKSIQSTIDRSGFHPDTSGTLQRYGANLRVAGSEWAAWRGKVEGAFASAYQETVRLKINKVLGSRVHKPAVSINFRDPMSQDELQEMVSFLQSKRRTCTCGQSRVRGGQPLATRDFATQEEISDELATVGGGWNAEDNIDDDPVSLERLRIQTDQGSGDP